MRVREVATGLWWWTALHPAWTPADGGPDGWEQEVGCVYYEAPGAVVLIDPLVPMEDRDRFFRALDRDVERAGLPVRVLTTVDAHKRSANELARRYHADPPRIPPTRPSLPAGVEIAVAVFEELVFWIPEHGAVVFGDLVIGRDGGLWLDTPWLGDHAEEGRDALLPLLDLPVERVLTGHGEPVLEGAKEALEDTLSL